MRIDKKHKKFLVMFSLSLFAFFAITFAFLSPNESGNALTGKATGLDASYYANNEEYTLDQTAKIHLSKEYSDFQKVDVSFVLKADVYYGSSNKQFSASNHDRYKKWTAAVNSVKGTNCNIPYGYVMYLYFGKGNSWNGVYRAEDTVSSLDEECKILLYAGEKGPDELAKEEVSGKNVQVFLLNKNYVYVTTAVGNKNTPPAVLGNLQIPYSHRFVATDVTSFYDITKSFVKSTIAECSKKPYDQRSVCIDQQIIKAKDIELDIQRNCAEISAPDKLDLQELAKTFEADKTIIRFGGVFQPTKLGMLSPNTVYLKQLKSDEIITVNFENDPLIDSYKPYFKEGNYIEFAYAKVKSISGNTLSITTLNGEKTLDERKNYIKINPDYYNKEILKNISLQIADCGSSKQQNCLCNVSVPGNITDISFAGKQISLTDFDVNQYVQIQYNVHIENYNSLFAALDEQGMAQGQIEKAPLADFSYLLQTKSFIELKKDADNDFIVKTSNKENALMECVPEKKYELFCAKNYDESKDESLIQNTAVPEPIATTPVYSSCPTQIDSLYINTASFSGKSRPKVAKTIQVLQETGKLEVIKEASKKYNIPVPVIISIINTEAGTFTQKYIDLDNIKQEGATCNPSYCGLMQVGKPACSDTIKTAGCNWNLIKINNDIDLGINVGVSYLNLLVNNYMGKNSNDPSDPYIDPKNPDWQFIALAFNAGFGEARNVMKHAKTRLGKTKFTDLKWEEITYSDISQGTTYSDTAKHLEIWAYPNFVGQAIADQCGGAYYAEYEDEPEPMRFALSI